MDEDHFREIEKVLLYVSEARRRAHDVASGLAKGRAEPHLVEAVHEAERELGELHRRLMQGTYWAVPKEQLSLSTRDGATLGGVDPAAARGLRGALERL